MPAFDPEDEFETVTVAVRQAGGRSLCFLNLPAFDPEDEFETVTIAVIDTEIDVSHPELSEKMLPGWDFYNNSDTVFVGAIW